MMNDVWLKMAEFLGRLNGESVIRESYVRTPEYKKALEVWKEKEQEWEDLLDILSSEQREKMEEINQGYVDCIQALYHMGLLKENEGLKLVGRMGIR